MKTACVTVRPWRSGTIEVTRKEEIILTSSIPQTEQIVGDRWGGQGMGENLGAQNLDCNGKKVVCAMVCTTLGPRSPSGVQKSL